MVTLLIYIIGLLFGVCYLLTSIRKEDELPPTNVMVNFILGASVFTGLIIAVSAITG